MTTIDNIALDFSRAISGKVYEEYGLKENPFYITPKKPFETLIGRENELKSTILSIANMLRGEVSHVAIVGAHGIGKTHFLYFLKEVLETQEIKSTINCSKVLLIKGLSDFNELFLRENQGATLIADFKKRRLQEERVFFLFDDLDVICQRYPIDMSLLFEQLEGGIIGTWESQAWKRKNDKCKVPKSEVVVLLKVPPKTCIQILENRIKEASLPNWGSFLPDFCIEGLAELSEGNPYRLITYARRLLKYILENKISAISREEFDRFIEEKLNFVSFDKLKTKFLGLSEKQQEILSILVEKIEVTAGELGAALGISRVGALQHLQVLMQTGLVSSKRKGRSVVFSIPTEFQDEVVSWIESQDKESSESVSNERGRVNCNK